jgi:predicted Zn finger-like uncharacterized protein
MKITCPACNANYRLPDDRIQGKNRIFKINCKRCGAEIRVRGVETQDDVGRTTLPFNLELPPTQTAPQPLAQVWFAGIGGKQVGPMAEAEVVDHIQQGRLGAQDLVWRKGFANWLPLREVPPFGELVADTKTPDAAAVDGGQKAEKRSPRRAQTLELSAAMIELLVKLDGQGADGTVEAQPPPQLPPLDGSRRPADAAPPVPETATVEPAIAGDAAAVEAAERVQQTAVAPVPQPFADEIAPALPPRQQAAVRDDTETTLQMSIPVGLGAEQDDDPYCGSADAVPALPGAADAPVVHPKGKLSQPSIKIRLPDEAPARKDEASDRTRARASGAVAAEPAAAKTAHDKGSDSKPADRKAGDAKAGDAKAGDAKAGDASFSDKPASDKSAVEMPASEKPAVKVALPGQIESGVSKGAARTQAAATPAPVAGKTSGAGARQAGAARPVTSAAQASAAGKPAAKPATKGNAMFALTVGAIVVVGVIVVVILVLGQPPAKPVEPDHSGAAGAIEAQKPAETSAAAGQQVPGQLGTAVAQVAAQAPAAAPAPAVAEALPAVAVPALAAPAAEAASAAEDAVLANAPDVQVATVDAPVAPVPVAAEKIAPAEHKDDNAKEEAEKAAEAKAAKAEKERAAAEAKEKAAADKAEKARQDEAKKAAAAEKAAADKESKAKQDEAKKAAAADAKAKADAAKAEKARADEEKKAAAAEKAAAAKAEKDRLATEAKAKADAAKAEKARAEEEKKAAAAAKAGGGGDDDEIDAILARQEKKQAGGGSGDKSAATPPAGGGSGTLDSATVKSVFERGAQKVMRCFLLHADVDGGRESIATSAMVNADGTVASARVTGKYDRTTVGKCVADVVKALAFPQSSGAAKKVSFTYQVDL